MLYYPKQKTAGTATAGTEGKSCQFFQRSKRQGKGRTRPRLNGREHAPPVYSYGKRFFPQPALSYPLQPSHLPLPTLPSLLPLFNCTIFIILPNCSLRVLFLLTSCSLLEKRWFSTSTGEVQLRTRGWGVFFVRAGKFAFRLPAPQKLNKGSLWYWEQLSPRSFTDKKLSTIDNAY